MGAKVEISAIREQVRRTPGGSVIANRRQGAKGVIVAGPAPQDGWIYWKVDFRRGKDGWLRQRSISPR